MTAIDEPVPGGVAPAPASYRNPLRDKRDKRLPRIAGPCGVVIFGVPGDLARKKLMPAIYDLAVPEVIARRVNVEGTRNLVEFAKAIDAGHLHHVSSIAAASLPRSISR